MQLLSVCMEDLAWDKAMQSVGDQDGGQGGEAPAGRWKRSRPSEDWRGIAPRTGWHSAVLVCCSALGLKASVSRAFGTLFQDVHVWVCPTLATPPSAGPAIGGVRLDGCGLARPMAVPPHTTIGTADASGVD